MNTHFLTDIEINAFKCFTDFKAAGFKRVNLIGGKNNIGKTAFMEAVYINVHALNVNALITVIMAIKFSRENLNYILKEHDDLNILDSTRKYSSHSNIRSVLFEIIEKDALKEYQLTINGELKNINAKELNITLTHIDNVQKIDNFGWADNELINAFEAIQKQDLENALNTFVNEFDDSIENFKVIGDKPQCKTHGIYRDITEFGDGLKHYISIICALYAAKDGYLFVDEIDNGIHYSPSPYTQV